MRFSDLVKYYSQKGFREFILPFSKGREVVPRFRNIFGSRPQSFRFEDELMEVIRKGVSSFHFSEEHWTNPMTLSPDMSRKDLDALRAGWDLIFDVDSSVFEYSRLCTKFIIDALEFHDIKEPSVKFSGGSGFHVGIRFNNPTKLKGKPVKDLFPEAPRTIGLYIQEMIKEYLRDALLEKESVEVIAKKAGLTEEEVMDGEEFNPLRVVNIDPVAISSRHLVRAPYSLNEKRWFVSVPLDPKEILSFTLDKARPDVVRFNRGYLDKAVDATELFIQAFDWSEREEKKKKVVVQYNSEVPKDAVQDDCFPPCINHTLKGLADGKKRALFMLINFFQKCGYSWPIIKERLTKWNEKNDPPLRGAYIASQINWAEKQGGLMPQNCSNPNYKDIGVCHPDNFCNKIKNPVTYALSKSKVMKKGKRGKSPKK